ncbi:unnamed protein product [Schistocephalus solidus]|uniref:Fibronectin type-III domain-containing protein n=1 Tax=Schistocephalus solidus TaxID=70667 RepID=A0A183SVQ5_SCHSO|nr:unnamed protein product [Schistocephalus solidus]
MPRGLTAVALNSTSIRVSWKSPNASIDIHFLVTFASEDGGWMYQTRETEYTPTELQPSTTYNITVRLLDEDDINFGLRADTYAKTLPNDVASTPYTEQPSKELNKGGRLFTSKESPSGTESNNGRHFDPSSSYFSFCSYTSFSSFSFFSCNFYLYSF